MKRSITTLTAIILALSLLFSTVLTANATTDFGDVDGNGEIESIDVTYLQRHLAEIQSLDEEAQKRAHVSENEELTVYDATLIQYYLARRITVFPAEEAALNTVTIRFTDNKKWGTVYAYFFNYTTKEALKESPGVLLTDPVVNSSGYNEYSIDVNVGKYDRVVFSNGNSKKTIETPVTKASCGFMISDKNKSKYDTDVYTGGQYSAGKILTKKFDYPGYPEGEQKTVWIYLPDGYDPDDTSKKYSVLYMDDGQVMLGTLPDDDWRCDKTVRSMMNNGSDGIIIVGISSLEGTRDSEMRPYIGEPIWDEGLREEFLQTGTEEELLEQYKDYCGGEEFADFTVNTVIPYVEANYNVNSVRGFTGSSGGGLMAFYIGLEYPEVFDYVGVMSPSLNIYDASVWDEYLSTKDFSGKVPRMYIFCGNKDMIEQILYPYSVEAESWLLAHDYPSDRVRTVTNDDTKHLHKYWGLYLPELLCWGLEL
ncbi:MAG: starch-binding protein [Ruminococcus sp.]|uniref:alpha/beta hydrolase-fold protein n=1 Tax=Ruminococcus sp. TaxID=41978 RepID=UPI002872FBCC|nr:alpha/beta hydrolase-fold protein [Ruminococcus sp.]MBQ3285705.1 starch-binding protein [Ruminococcus sp.]